MVACVLIAIIAYLGYSGRIVLSDYWTGLAVALSVSVLTILYWGFKPQIDRFFGENKNLQEGKTETVWVPKEETQESAKLPDFFQITKFRIDNSLLNELYELARREAINLYDDARLSAFTFQVFPYANQQNVNIYFKFYSKWADKLCTFISRDYVRQVEHWLPDKRPMSTQDRAVLVSLPWKESPQWIAFVEKTYAKIEPLTPSRNSSYHVIANASDEVPWFIKFEDGFNGKECAFKWDGKGLDETSIKRAF